MSEHESAAAPPPPLVRIMIKAALSAYECHVAVPPTLTAGELKRVLAREYEGRPAPSDQRLSFRGRALHDAETIERVVATADAGTV